MSIFMMLFAACTGQNNTKDFNGGFEIKSFYTNAPANWYPADLHYNKKYVSFIWDDQEKHSGDRSVSIAINNNHPDKAIAYTWMRGFEGYTINGEYTLTGWIKTKDINKSAFIAVQCLDKNNSTLEIYTSEKNYPVTGTEDWTQVRIDFTVTEGTEEVLVRAGIAAPENNGGKVWFDDIEIK